MLDVKGRVSGEWAVHTRGIPIEKGLQKRIKNRSGGGKRDTKQKKFKDLTVKKVQEGKKGAKEWLRGGEKKKLCYSRIRKRRSQLLGGYISGQVRRLSQEPRKGRKKNALEKTAKKGGREMHSRGKGETS